MKIEGYTKMIEHPMTWGKSRSEALTIRAAILRTIRIVLLDPKLAREYYDSIPKATMDIVETSKSE